MAPHDVMDLMTKVSSWSAHEAALFDLLTGQGDRHGESSFLMCFPEPDARCGVFIGRDVR